jgi:hypothetical protein
MATQEIDNKRLTDEVRLQTELNRIRGDRKSWRGGKWKLYGTDISSYERSFNGALGESVSIESLLKDKQNPVVIDLMSPSEAISSLFKFFPDKQKFGLALSLEDRRSDRQKKKDAEANIVQIAGDIMSSRTWDTIEEKLQGRKADLIMVRPVGGFICIPEDLRLYTILLNKAWRLLGKDSGVLLFEVPFWILQSLGPTEGDTAGSFTVANSVLVDKLKNLQVDMSYGTSPLDVKDFCFGVKLTKAPNSPDKLRF